MKSALVIAFLALSICALAQRKPIQGRPPLIPQLVARQNVTAENPDVTAARKRLATVVTRFAPFVSKVTMKAGAFLPGGVTLSGEFGNCVSDGGRAYWDSNGIEALIPRPAMATYAVMVINGFTNEGLAGFSFGTDHLISKPTYIPVTPASDGTASQAEAYSVSGPTVSFKFSLASSDLPGTMTGITSVTVYFFRS